MAGLVDPNFVRRIALRALVGCAIAGAAIALAAFRQFFLLVLLGLVFTELFQAIADPLAKRFGGSRTVWIALAVVLVLGVIVGAVALCMYPLASQLADLVGSAPKVVRALGERAENLGRWLDGTAPSAPPAPGGAGLDKVVAERAGELALGGGAVVVTAIETLFKALAVVFLGVFVAATPRDHRRAFLGLLPEKMRPRGQAFVGAARQGLRNWMVAVTVSMAIMGVLVTAGLWWIGVPYFLVFGVFAGIMELVPYLGPVLAFAAPTILCLATEPEKAVYCGIFYVVCHGLEANVVVPLVVKNRAHVPPSLVILAILVFGSMAGIIGLIAATPVLTIILAAVKELWLEPHTTGASEPRRDEPEVVRVAA